MITIRFFQLADDDYKRSVDIFNAVWVDQQETVDEWREREVKWAVSPNVWTTKREQGASRRMLQVSVRVRRALVREIHERLREFA